MIDVRNVRKVYERIEKTPGLWGAVKSLFVQRRKTFVAVEHLNFQIQQGEMVAYIGANGAGKSTTIKLLCGILTPTEGEVLINGIDPSQKRIQNAKQIGAVFGQRTQLLWDLPVRESFELLKHIYEVEASSFGEMYDLCVHVLQLEALLNVPVRQLSLGQKMRCELAAAFLHSPSIVYLDEPTIGLDVSVKARIRTFIREMNRVHRTTVILTSHDMQDIEELCQRVILIDQGKIMYDGSIDQLKKEYGQERIVEFHMESSVEWRQPERFGSFVTVKHADSEDVGHTVSVGFDPTIWSASEIISEVLKTNKVNDLKVLEGSIETIVRAIYERNGGG